MKKTAYVFAFVLFVSLLSVQAYDIKEIVQKYRENKTFSINEQCAESSADFWNLLNKSGVDAELCVGNVNEDISSLSSRAFFNKLNHAWVVADGIAVETTGGFLVDREMNSNYYSGLCFDDVNKFNEFVETSDRYYDVCHEALALQKEFEYSKASEKINECNALFEKLENFV